LTVRQAPAVTFTGLNPDYCINEPAAALTGNPPGGAFSGPGAGGSTFVPFLAGPGVHQITYHYTAPNGCDGSQTQTTIVTDQPVITFNISPNEYCVTDSPVILTATPSGGTYSGTGIVGNTFVPSLAGAGGPYIITYTFTDTIGCRNTSMANQGISVNPLPVVSLASIGTEYCLNDSPVILSGVPAGGIFSGNGVSGNTFDPGIAGTGIQQITYTYTDNNGCSNSQTISTFVQPLPVVSLSGLAPLYCVEDAVVLLSGNPPGGSYSGPGLIANAFDPALAGAGGPYTITYSYTDANGCTGAHSLVTSVNDIPEVSIAGLNAVHCLYEGPVTLTLVPAGGQLTGNGISGNTFNPSAAGVGNHFITYVYSDVAGCTNSTVVNVRVDECVGVNVPDAPVMDVFPNPATGKVNVLIIGKNISGSKLIVYNITGQKVMQFVCKNSAQNSIIIDLTTYPKGVYGLHLELENMAMVKKVVME
ncbi:MAG TPA: T9SS type A sorting domain-containing protein, partial [Chitinophagales bacterium]|nr:T9SS type A sorting domain-containing protein [Chitinophagales bacterium]